MHLVRRKLSQMQRRGLRPWQRLRRQAGGPEWRNWQTQRIQNPSRFTPRKGSSPFSGTTCCTAFGHRAGSAWALAAAIAIAAPVRGDDCPTFASPFAVVPTGEMPVDVVRGDFDADGRDEYVFANYYGQSLTLLFGDLGRSERIGVRSGPRALAVGDVDGDGNLDIAVACLGRVALRRGLGDGTFTAWPDLWTDVTVVQIALGDFDADAVADLVLLRVIGDDTTRLEFWKGGGDGNFLGPTLLPLVARAEVLAGAYLDAGPTLDLAIGTVNGLVLWFGGDAAPAPALPLGGVPTSIFATTAAVALTYQANVFGTAVQHARWIDVAASGEATAGADAIVPEYGFDVTIADIDDDLVDDVVVLGLRMQPLRRVGNQFIYGRPGDVGPYASAVAISDVDRDGHVDAIIADALTGPLVSYGRGGGNFGQSPLYTTTMPQSVSLGDLDGDGVLDAVFAGALTGHVSAHRGNGSGGFGARTDISSLQWATAAQLADFDADGALDIVVVTLEHFQDPETGRMAVHRGNGRGGFDAPRVTPLAGPATGVCVADWNRDGHADVAVAVWDSLYPRGGGIQVFAGRGDLQFDAPTRWGVGPLPMDVAAGDLDADGFVDLVATFRQFDGERRGGITWWRGAPGGMFTARADIPTGVEPRRLVIAHIDFDAIPDVVVANSHFARPEPGRIVVLRATGNSLVKIADEQCSSETYAPVVADFDGDGAADVAVTNSGSHTVALWRGDGTGALTGGCEIGTGPRPIAIATGDLDGDDRDDLVTGDTGGASATILMRVGIVTPVTLAALTALSGADGTTLAWTLGMPAAVAWVQVERAASEAGPFAAIGARLAPAATMQFVDAQPPPLAAYRVRVALHSGREWTSAAVRAAAPTAFALAPPLLGTDGVRFNWVLPHDMQRAHLAIVDARGRRVCDLVDGAAAAGAHAYLWNRRDNGGRAVARGLYWATLVADGRRVAQRVLVASH